MTLQRFCITASTILLLGATPSAPLPALLQPQVHAGEVFRYQNQILTSIPSNRLSSARPLRTLVYADAVSGVSSAGIVWTRTSSFLGKAQVARFSSDATGTVFDSDRHAASIRSFMYNTALFGKPPAELSIGERWTNTVNGANTIDSWTVTVADVQPASDFVRLHLLLQTRDAQVSRYSFGDRWREGDVVFERGIMTSLSLRGTDWMFSDPPRLQSVGFDPTLPAGGANGFLSTTFSLPDTASYLQEITLQTTP